MIDFSNKIFLFGGFYPESSEKVVKGIIEKFDSGLRELELYINSDGGRVSDLFAITDTIDKYKKEGLKVTTVSVGEAQSAGAILLMYGDNRYAGKSTTIMVHGAQGGLYGDEEDLKLYLSKMGELNDKLSNIIAQKIGIPVKEARKLLKRNNYFTAQEAVDYGIIDGIWDIEETVSEFSKYIQESIAASANPQEDVLDVMRFVASIKKSNNNTNEDNNMAEQKDFALELEAANNLTKEFKSKVESVSQENERLKKQVEDSEKYKTEFYNKQKEGLIVKAKNLISKDTGKQSEFEAKLRNYIGLEYDKFESLVKEFVSANTNAVYTGIVIDSTNTDQIREAQKKMTEPEKDVDNYFASVKKVDISYAKQTMGGK